MTQRILPLVTLIATATIALTTILLPASASERELPIYSVNTTQKICSISFDAAWADVRVR